MADTKRDHLAPGPDASCKGTGEGNEKSASVDPEVLQQLGDSEVLIQGQPEGLCDDDGRSQGNVAVARREEEDGLAAPVSASAHQGLPSFAQSEFYTVCTMRAPRTAQCHSTHSFLLLCRSSVVSAVGAIVMVSR